jgi:hypothetical protein
MFWPDIAQGSFTTCLGSHGLGPGRLWNSSELSEGQELTGLRMEDMEVHWDGCSDQSGPGSQDNHSYCCL